MLLRLLSQDKYVTSWKVSTEKDLILCWGGVGGE